MFKNYLLTSLRYLKRHQIFTFLNVLGLGIGMGCTFLILLFIVHELGYDQFQSQKEQLYRVKYGASNGMELVRVPPPIAPEMAEFFPEVAAAARLYTRNLSILVPAQPGREEKSFEETRVFFADSTLPQLFDFEVLDGSPDALLQEPYRIWISDETAEKYFGSGKAVGQLLTVNGRYTFEVGGVFRKYPNQSHIHFNVLIPYQNMFDIEPEQIREVLRENLSRNFVISHSLTYVKLKPGADPAGIDAKFDAFVKKYAPVSLQMGQKFSLQKFTDIHLRSNLLLEVEPVGSIQYLYVLGAIALITLLIASFNFINLATAQSVKRAKEVGVRKVMGAVKKQLFFQFMSESAIVCLMGGALALVMVNLFLPSFSTLAEREFTYQDLNQPWVVGGFVLVILATAFLGGSYPAFFMTRVQTVTVLKGKISTKARGRFSLRKILVVFQFASSVVLITSTIFIFKQLTFLQNRSLGFDKELIIGIPLLSQNLHNVFGGINGEARSRLNTLEDRLLSHPNISATTLSDAMPGTGSVNRMVTPEGFDSTARMFAPIMAVDYDYIDLYGLQLVAGRKFSKEAGSDHLDAFIVNEAAVSKYNWGTPEQAIGKKINLEGKRGTVIGVLKDFHHSSLRFALNEMVMHVSVPNFQVLSVKMKGNDAAKTLEFLEQTWKEFFPEKSFEYTYLDATLAQQYQAEERLGKIIGIFAGLAILVSCLGSYGLVMYQARQREKEIGVRKVLGASFYRIITLLFTEFTWLYIISIAFSLPVTWYIAQQWMEDFPYKITLGWDGFVLGGMATLLIGWLSISYQSIKTAFINPIKCLREN